MYNLQKTTEEYRVNTEAEAADLIQDAKNQQASSNYVLKKYASTEKTKKEKGEVVDSWYIVTLVKSFIEE